MKTWISNGVTGVLVVCALLVTVVVIRREFAASATVVSTRVEDWTRLLDQRAPVIGNESAARKVVVFSDYECPFCSDLEIKLTEIDAAHPNRFAVLRYERPLTQIHAHAMDAAIAAKCAAGAAGYQAFHAALVAHGTSLGAVEYRRLAEQAGLPDVESFEACRQSAASRKAVESDIATAEKLGIRSTPTLVVEGLHWHAGSRDAEGAAPGMTVRPFVGDIQPDG